MKNGPGAGGGGGEQTRTMMSRKEILDDYVKYYSHTSWSEGHVKVCNDARLIARADRFLLSEETEPRERFETLPFYQIVLEGRDRECSRSYLKGFVKAAEVLELLCVNLFLYPWKKEFKTLKTFTGAFVYSLLPVLSSSTIQSVLALIGYLPDRDTKQRTSSQYRLSEEASPDRAMAVGFELLLARLECQHILRLTEQAKRGSQDWAEILQRRAMHHGSHTEETLGQPSETTAVGQENDEMEEKEEIQEDSEVPRVCSVVDREDGEENEKDDDTSGNQASEEPLSLEARPKAKPRLRQGVAPMSSTRHLLEDRSILEMQRNYPDLAIRGRPLLQNKKRTGSSSSNSVKAVSVDSTDKGNGSKTASNASSDHNSGVKAASDAVGSSNDSSKADNVPGNNVSSEAGNQVASVGRNNSSRSNSNSVRGRRVCDATNSSDRSRAGAVSSESDLSGPSAISMHITLRAGTTQPQTSEDKTLKFEDHRPEPLPRAARRGDQPSGGLPKSVLSSKEQPSMSFIEEEELAERMGHLHLQEKKASRRRDGKTKNEEKKRTGEKDEEDDVPALQNFQYSVEESVDDDFNPGQSGPREGNQPILCHPSAVTTCNITNCHSCKEEDGTGGGQSGRGSEEDGERGMAKDQVGGKEREIDQVKMSS